MNRGWALAAAAAFVTAGPAAAQGQSAAHDLGGLWEAERFFFKVDNPPLTPAAQAMVDSYQDKMKSGQIIYTGWTSCRPGAANAMVMTMNTIAILQTADEITLLYEEPRMNRRIRLNATHPANVAPSYLGDSVGRWDGDTLVVDTIGYNGQFELDAFALPTSTRMHTIERFTPAPDGKRISIIITFDDPEFYSAPFSVERTWKASDKRHQFDYDCSENPREEEFSHTYFVKDLYRPTCIRHEGQGADLSKIICTKPEDEPGTQAPK
uniref:hypothetical protein n=1 Tax=Altererythrobacter segetis TaxID=1104773 RepID=UPI00140C05FC|nr:hypothetical protein [Altererythrobacter segetis]